MYSFKISEKPSKFSESVCVVIVVSVYSQQLRRHHIRGVNDYFSTCPGSQQLRRHGVSVVNVYVDKQFLKISNNFFFFFHH